MSELHINTWQNFADEKGIEQIAELEQTCWSPWLAASLESLAGRAEVFPNGQLSIYSDEGLLATLSVNEVNWDGQPVSLPSWDDVAGEPTTYEHTYTPGGNTLCLMSMNVSEHGRGKQLPRLLIGALLEFAEKSGVDHVIGSFRPSAYSQAVLMAVEKGVPIPTFEEYCEATNDSGDLIDPWLRSLSKNGMQPLAIDHSAMSVPVTGQEFESLMQPDWRQITINGELAWWCNETGFFYPQADGSYVYRESNLWGTLYDKQ